VGEAAAQLEHLRESGGLRSKLLSEANRING
jgi:hypothetical protein